MFNLKFKFLDKLTPRQKQIAGLVLAILVLGALTVLISSSMEKSKKKSVAAKASVNPKKMTLLTEKVEKDLWVAAEGQNIKALETSNAEIRSQMEKMKKEIEETKEQAKKKVVVTAPHLPPPAAPRKGINAGAVPTVPGTTACTGPSCTGASTAVGPTPFPSSLQEARPSSPVFQQGTSSASHPASAAGGPPRPGESSSSGAVAGAIGGTIRMFKNDDKRSDAKPVSDLKKEAASTYMPAGSFMKAVLLSGIDAPTSGGKASGEPYPVLMGVTDLSVLPNRFRMNLKECFIIGAGLGNISDERAYIRTETLSCVRTDNKVIEISMKGHVMGEDGKLGLRGRLVSKQGQQIAMAIFAGTLSGLSTAITPTQTPQYNLFSNPSGGSTTTSYSHASLGDVGQSAALGGAGSALNLVATYYLKMAEKLFPIIEIDAGRIVEVVVLKGQELKVAGGKTKTLSRSK